MAFSKDIVAAVKDRADIVEVIGERVLLKPNGADFVGLCPFHGEKTPSFRVSPSWRTYHCFGCGAGGSVIDFVMAQERLSFPEALRNLAERYGVPLPSEGPGAASGARSLEVLQAAEGYYRDLLRQAPQGEPARIYLRERGFLEPDWEAFGLGWALDQWQGFLTFGRSKGFSVEDLIASGLVRQRETGRAFDMLRKRVAIPIRDERGRAIAFGGRVIDAAEGPKYLNTPETRHYHKSRVLFGLSQGLPTVRQSKRALLVEGYLDVMRLHQHGFSEAVATCGTALTEEHLKLLGRYAERVLLVFDGDEAGVKAALRSAPLFLNSGLEARVVLLPDQLDPDDFLRRHPPEAFAALLEDAPPLLEFLVFQLSQRHDRSLQGRQQVLDALLPVLSQIGKPTARDLTVRYVADLLSVSTESIISTIRPKVQDGSKDSMPSKFSEPHGRRERRWLILLMKSPKLIEKWRDQLWPGRFSEFAFEEMVATLRQLTKNEASNLTPEEIIELFPERREVVRSLLIKEGYFVQGVTDAELESEYAITRLLFAIGREAFSEIRKLTGTEKEKEAVEQYMRFSLPMATRRNGFRRPHPIRKDREAIAKVGSAKFLDAKIKRRISEGSIEAISQALDQFIQVCKQHIPPGPGKSRLIREAEEFGEHAGQAVLREIERPEHAGY